MKSGLGIFFIAIVLTLYSCYYDNEEELYPIIGIYCDTTDVVYSPDIKDVINNRCITCHASSVSATLGGGRKFDSYTLVSAQADVMFGAISHAEGYSPMPKSAPKLDNCTIQKFENWIQDGKPEE